MGVVERTPEFRQILADLGADGKGLVGAGGAAASEPLWGQSELNVCAADIGGGIHDASLGVRELHKLAKKTGNFNDPTRAVREVSHQVKEKLQVLKEKCEALDRRVLGARPRGGHDAHATCVVKTLRDRLAQVDADFQRALSVRAGACQEQARRRQLYSSRQGFAARIGSPPEDIEAGGAQAVAVHAARASSRDGAVREVQRRVLEAGRMLQGMAALVAAQQDPIDGIVKNVDQTTSYLQQGQQQLLHHLEHASSDRGLIIKVFLILIMFVVFFVVFLA